MSRLGHRHFMPCPGHSMEGNDLSHGGSGAELGLGSGHVLRFITRLPLPEFSSSEPLFFSFLQQHLLCAFRVFGFVLMAGTQQG